MSLLNSHDKESYSRPSWDKIFLEILEIVAKRSMCLKMNTAALVVKDTQIISIGYNGTFSKHEECIDYWKRYYVENIRNKFNIEEDIQPSDTQPDTQPIKYRKIDNDTATSISSISSIPSIYGSLDNTVDLNNSISSSTTDSSATDTHNSTTDTSNSVALRSKGENILFNLWIQTPYFKTLHKQWSALNEIHAEANALKWIPGNKNENYVMYTLYSPCDACAKDIIAHGIKKVYYKHLYKHGIQALKILEKSEIQVVNIF